MKLLTDIVHAIFGFLGAIFNQLTVFTAIFLTYQALDVIVFKEAKREISYDIAEYSVGMIAGLCLSLIS